MMEENPESLLIEIQDRLKRLETNLPRRVDGFATSPVSKLPSKVLVCRATLMWRMAELARCAIGHFGRSELASAILLTRAAIETSATVWYLHKKLSASVESGTVGDIDEYLMKLLMGSKNDPAMPDPVNVLTFVDYVDQEIVGFRSQYDSLSEFAHPNWAGTSLLYAKPDPANGWTDFGVNVRAAEGPRIGGIANLSVALLVFEESCNHIERILASFIAICEKNLKA